MSSRDPSSGPTSSASDVALVFGALLIVFALVLAKPLGHPLPAAASLLIWLALPAASALWLAGREAPALLGLTRFDVRGVATVCLGSLPMLLGLALTAEQSPHFDQRAFYDGAARAPLVGELLFRGLAFGEAFRTSHAIAFEMLWCAIAIYMFDGLLDRRARLAAAHSA